MSTGKRPAWLLFASQVFVEIHHVLSTKSQQPLEIWTDWGLKSRRTLRGHHKFIEKHGIPSTSNTREEFFISSTRKDIEKWVLEVKMSRTVNKYLAEARLSPNGHFEEGSAAKYRQWEDNEALRIQPSLCGLWKYSFQLKLQHLGLQLVNQSQTMVAARLYNALQQNGHLDRDCIWLDTENLLNTHRKADTFGGSRPRRIEDCVRCLALAQGMSPQRSDACRCGRNQQVVSSKKKVRFLREATPIAGIFI